MIDLAVYLIEGEEAAQNVTVLEQLADALLDHPEAADYSPIYSQVLIIQARLFELQWKTGNLTTQEYHRGVRGMLIMAIQVMTRNDYRHWNLPILQECLDWLAADQLQPQDVPEPV